MNLPKQMHAQHELCQFQGMYGGEFQEALLGDVSGCTKWAMGVNSPSHGS